MSVLDRLRALTGLPRKVAALEAEVRDLRRHLDAFKSAAELPAGLQDEFLAWRAANPLPDQPLVSICIATYNRCELLLERSLRSALAQTYPNLEVVVVGDGCTDGTEERVSAIEDPRLVFVNLSDRGAYPDEPTLRWMVAGTHPMNHALRTARGDLITHLDDDDEHPPERIAALVEAIRAADADLVWHPFWHQQTDGTWDLNAAEEYTHGQVTTSSVLYRSWLRRIEWDPDAYRLREPGDWHRFRRIGYVATRLIRHPEPLLRHYRERNQQSAG